MVVRDVVSECSNVINIYQVPTYDHSASALNIVVASKYIN